MEVIDDLLTICVPGKGHTKSSICVKWHKEYCMKSHPLHNSIELEWEKKHKGCVSLFNASKFRLHGVEVEKSDDDNLPVIKLLVGTTTYKDFIGTNCSSYADQLVQDGIKHFSNSQSYMSDPIGVGALLVTIDDYLIFIRRSQNCAEMPDMIDRPGGHPEPDEVVSTTGQSLEDVDPLMITEEIFNSVLKEIRDEVNIPLHELSPPILLGIGYNSNTWKRPSMEFYVRCNLNADGVRELYLKQTQAESEESTEILMIPVAEALKKGSEGIMYYDELTPAAKSALFLLKIFSLKKLECSGKGERMNEEKFKKLKETTRDRHLMWINFYSNNNFGIWIECTACKKWRTNHEYSESHEVPENWCCSMNTLENGQKGSCDDPEENTDEDYLEHCPGSVVWAKLEGYPWWPAMVDENPDIEEFFWRNRKGTPFYNVTFLDEHVTHAWIPARYICPFLKPPKQNSCLRRPYKQNKYSASILKAEERAQAALEMTIKERLQKFSFVHLYRGKWPLADNFDVEENPHDMTDILLQEVDDLDSINSSDTDGEDDANTFNGNRDHVEEKVISNDSDPKYALQRKSRNGILNGGFEDCEMYPRITQKPNKNSETFFSKSVKTTKFKKTMTKKETVTCSKGIKPSLGNESGSLKKSKNTNLLGEKLKSIEIDCLRNVIDKEHKLESMNSDNIVSTDACYSKTDNNERKDLNKEEMNAEEKKHELLEVNSKEVDNLKSNKCASLSPMNFSANICKENVELTKVVNSPTNVNEENWIQNKEPDCVIESTTQDTKSTVATNQSTEFSNKNFLKFINNLDECITSVINNTDAYNQTTDLPPISIKPQKKKEKENGKCKNFEKMNELKMSTKDFYEIHNGVHKVTSIKRNDMSIPNDYKQKKCENKDGILPVKKRTKLTSEGKVKKLKSNNELNKTVACENEKNITVSPNEDSAKTQANGHKEIGSLSDKKKLFHNTNSGCKIKPAFKTFKRPLKDSNLTPQDNVMNKKQCSEVGTKGNGEIEQQTHRKLLNTSETNVAALNKKETNLNALVEKEPIKKIITNSINKNKPETTTDVGSNKTSEPVDITAENKYETITIDADDNTKSYTTPKVTDDCFFYIPISDEEFEKN